MELNEWLDQNIELIRNLQESWQDLDTPAGKELYATSTAFEQGCFALKRAIDNFAAEPFEPEEVDADTLCKWAEEYNWEVDDGN